MWTGQDVDEARFLWNTFEQYIPKDGCSDTQVDAEFATASVSTKATIRPEPSVCSSRSATTTSSVSTPAASLLAHRHRVFGLTSRLRGDVKTYANVLLKWGRAGRRQPHSTMIQWQDNVKTTGSESRCMSFQYLLVHLRNSIRYQTRVIEDS